VGVKCLRKSGYLTALLAGLLLLVSCRTEQPMVPGSTPVGRPAAVATNEVDTALRERLGITVMQRAPGGKRSIPPEATPEQCRELGRIDGAADRAATIRPSATRGTGSLFQERLGAPLQIQVDLQAGPEGFLCGNAYGEGYQDMPESG
jgi:hypothetical protein